jgi:ELWxxDGT repeat protein
MDWIRPARSRNIRRQREREPIRLEALEERMLLSLTLVKDINPVNINPTEITRAVGNIYFVARTAYGGADLDVKTATGVTVLKDVPASSLDWNFDPGLLYGLTPAGSKLFFLVATDASPQLWVTDGTAAGTTQVNLKLPQSDSPANFGTMTAVGSELFFTVLASTGDGSSASILYQSDGTAAGSGPVAPPKGAKSATVDADDLLSQGGSLYFSSAGELLKTNGNGTDTTVVGTYATGDEALVANLTSDGSSFYFTARTTGGQSENLYVSNGTASGTKLLKKFVPAPATFNDPVGDLTVVGSKLFFAVDDAAHGPSLWISNGTASGTTLVKSLKDVVVDFGGVDTADGTNFFSPIFEPTAVGTKLFFVTESSAPGSQPSSLWVSNGTAAGTTKVASITLSESAYSHGFAAGQLATLGGTLYFANDDPAHGMELWRSNGTTAGTTLASDLNPGAGGSYPADMTVIGNSLYFSGSTAAGSSALWQSDGTAAGTQPIATVGAAVTASGVGVGTDTNFSASNNQISPPDTVATLGNAMIFVADDGVHGDALWRSDGTTAATTLIKLFNTGAYPLRPSDFATAGNKVYFTTGTGAQTSLWATDGTAAGTTRVLTTAKTLAHPTPFNGKLAFFESNNDGSGLSLWLTDGTASGTRQIHTFPNGGSSGPSPTMVVSNGTLYVLAPQSVNGELASESVWVSNGTAAGTKPLVAKPAYSSVQSITASQNGIAFTANPNAPALWVSNGTSAGTKRIANLPSAGPGSYTLSSSVVAAGGKLYVVAMGNDSTASKNVDALYVSDGTAKGTVLLHNFVGAYNTVSAGLADGKLFFAVAGFGTTKMDAWVTDGTAAGTVPVPGLQVSENGPGLVTLNGEVYFQGTDSTRGTELWQSDGTVAGTTLLQDIIPGPASSYPYVLGTLHGNLIVAANDGVHGNELLTSGDPTIPEPALAAIGPQTVIATNQLTFTASGTPSATGDAIVYSLGSTAPAGAAIDPATGVFTWTPKHPMSASIPIVLTDQTTGLSTTEIVNVKVTGVKPTVAASGAATVSANTLFIGSGTYSAPSYATLTATVRYGDGTGAHPLALKNGTFSLKNTYKKAGNDTVVVTLTDQYGDSSSASLVVTVTPKPPADSAVSVIKTVNPVNVGPAQFTEAGGKLYFVATDADGTSHLEVKSPTGVATLLSASATSTPPAISELTPVGSRLYFIAGLNGSGELYVTDGTPAGTVPIRPKGVPANSQATYSGLTAVGSELYFAFWNGNQASSLMLYKTDGTAGGTVPVPPPAGSASSTISPDGNDLFGFGGALYFSSGGTMMKTSGTVTTVIKDLPGKSASGYSYTSLGNVTVAGGVFYFTTTDASNGGLDLFVSDGTTSGTALLEDFARSENVLYTPLGDLTAVGSRLFFAVNDAAHGPSLWVSTGTVAGTTLVKSLGTPPPNYSAVSPTGSWTSFNAPIFDPTGVGSRLFFATAAVGSSGTTLWVSDGTTAGTATVASINLPQQAGYENSALLRGPFAALGDTLYFPNVDPTHGSELWQSDGTAAGTHRVTDLNRGPTGSYPGNLTAIGNTLYFSAATAAGSSAVWSSDGTAAGTKLVVTVGPGVTANSFFASNSGPVASATLGGVIVFPADDAVHGIGLWKTDGTAAGTTLIKVLGAAPFASSPIDFTTVGSKVYFVTPGATSDMLWVTDGTTAGTRQVTTVNTTVASLTYFNGKLAFLQSNPDGSKLTLWLSDGTANGTRAVKTFPNLDQGSSQTPSMLALGGTLYITAPLSVGGEFASDSVWVSDGTSAGTRPLEANNAAIAGVDSIVAFHGKVYFAVSTSAPNPGFWVTNGTPAGTSLVKNFDPDAARYSVQLVAAGPTLYVLTTGNGGRLAIMKSDGTARGTVVLHTMPAGDAMAAVGLPNGHLLATVVNQTNQDLDLWVSDGTPAGTGIVPRISAQYNLPSAAIDGRVYLQEGDDAHGVELWQSDGTVKGTTLLQDLSPGAGSSSPIVLGALNGRLIVAANDGIHGERLMSVRIPPPADVTAGVATPRSARPQATHPALTPREQALALRAARREALRAHRAAARATALAARLARLQVLEATLGGRHHGI